MKRSDRCQTYTAGRVICSGLQDMGAAGYVARSRISWQLLTGSGLHGIALGADDDSISPYNLIACVFASLYIQAEGSTSSCNRGLCM